MFKCDPYRDELIRRIETIERILRIADPTSDPQSSENIAREARGMAVLLLFACYENLLRSLCRGLLERAVSLRVGNRRLQTGFRQFAVYNILKSISNSGESKIWKSAGRELIECAFDSRKCTVDTNIFPADGSFMKRSQVRLFCEIFCIDRPGSILCEVWDKIDVVVIQRNQIAHGQSAPEEVGRSYSYHEIRSLVDSWRRRWLEFIDVVELNARVRDFYRK